MESNKTSFLQQFLHRRMHMVFITFAMTLWGAIEFTSFIVERYGFSQQWIDIIFFAGIAFTPSVLLVGWNHGAPGKDKWTLSEKYGVPINFIAILVVFINTDMDSRTSPASHLKIPIEVARADSLRLNDHRSGVFYFLSSSLPQGHPLTSMQSTLPVLIQEYFNQWEKFSVSTVYGNENSSKFERLRLSGFTDDSNVPESLQRRIAIDDKEDFYIQGKLKQYGDQVQLNIYIYQLQPLDSKWQKSYLVNGLESLANELSHDIEIVLNAKRQPQEEYVIPAGELFDNSSDSLDLHVEALRASIADKSINLARELSHKSVQQDSRCYPCIQNWIEFAKQTGAVQFVEQGLQLLKQIDYKIPHYHKDLYLAFSHRLQGDSVSAEIVFNNWNKKYPDNWFVTSKVVNFYHSQNMLKKALEVLERYHKLRASDERVLLALGSLYYMSGNVLKAKGYFDRFGNAYQHDNETRMYLAHIEMALSNFELAEQHLVKYVALEPDDLKGYLSLARIQFSSGKLIEAEQTLRQAYSLSSDNSKRTSVMNSHILQLIDQKRNREAMLLIDELYKSQSHSLSAIRLFSSTVRMFYQVYLDAGQMDKLLARIAKARNEVEPKNQHIVIYTELLIALATKDIDAAQRLASDYQQSAIQFYPKFDPESLEVDEQILQIKGEHQRFLDILEQRYQHHVENSGTNNMYQRYVLSQGAESYIALGQYKKLIKRADGVLKSFPYEAPINYYAALSYSKLGQKQKALAALEKALHMWQNADEGAELPQKARELHKELTSNNG